MRRCCCITGGRSSAAACSMPWPAFLLCDGVRVCVAQGKICSAVLLPLGHCGCQLDCRKIVKFKGSAAALLVAGAAQPPAVCNDQPPSNLNHWSLGSWGSCAGPLRIPNCRGYENDEARCLTHLTLLAPSASAVTAEEFAGNKQAGGSLRSLLNSLLMEGCSSIQGTSALHDIAAMLENA